jgi:hypothetical protein
MKCALLLPGHMGHYKYTFLNQYETIIKPNNCDIFISTSNLVTNWINSKDYVTKKHDSQLLENEIRSVYGDRLKGLIINEEEDNNLIPSPIQWKRLKECFEQKTDFEKKNNIEYDVIFRSRTDLVFSRPLIVEKIKAGNDSVSLMRHFDSNIPVHDQFAYGNHRSMKKYCALIDVFKSREVGGRSEDQLNSWLKSQDIEVRYIEDFYFQMIRGQQ